MYQIIIIIVRLLIFQLYCALFGCCLLVLERYWHCIVLWGMVDICQ